MNTCLVGFGLGGNAPNSRELLSSAMTALSSLLRNPSKSSVHQTAQLGPGTRRFVNAVLVGEDTLARPSWNWLEVILDLERQAGRDRSVEISWGDRPLDIDLLFVGTRLEVTRELILPHPQLHRRSFVLNPLVEVLPEWVHPVLGRTVREFRVSLEG